MQAATPAAEHKAATLTRAQIVALLRARGLVLAEASAARRALGAMRLRACEKCAEWGGEKCSLHPGTPCQFKAYLTRPFAVCFKATKEYNPWPVPVEPKS